jgi:osmotically-inducible protein OsmY
VALKNFDIEVKHCVARLSGTVSSGTQRVETTVVARSPTGVCSVPDDLRIVN